MIAAALRLALAGSMIVAPSTAIPPVSVPPPRVQPSTVTRSAPARPIAVVTVGVGALTLISSLALIGVGAHSWRHAARGRTEGEAHAYVHNGKNLVVIGSSLAVAGVALLAGGIAWIVRDKRRPRGGALAGRQPNPR